MNEGGKGGSGRGRVMCMCVYGGGRVGEKSVKKAGYLPSLGEGESPSGGREGWVGEEE